MSSVRKSAAWLVMGLVLSAPTLSCFEPADATSEEQACCREMAERCGSSAMPDSHSCCTTHMGTSTDSPVLHTSAVQIEYSLPIVTAIATVIEPADHRPIVAAAVPAESPPRSIQILRI